MISCADSGVLYDTLRARAIREIQRGVEMIHSIMASVDKVGYRDIDPDFLVKVYPSEQFIPKRGLAWGDVFPAASPCQEICEALSGRPFWCSQNIPGAHWAIMHEDIDKGAAYVLAKCKSPYQVFADSWMFFQDIPQITVVLHKLP